VHVQTYEAAGLEAPVETWGSGGPTLVFLPGLGVDPREYGRGFELLAGEFQVIVPNLSFRGGRTLPRSINGYLSFVTALADDVAPDAIWAGHSFGALLAMLGSSPAIACAPSVPAEVALPRMFARAIRMQVREYLGFEGRTAIAYAARTMIEYVSTAALRPRSLFSITGALNSPPHERSPRCPNAVVYLSKRDELYRREEYSAYFGAALTSRFQLVEVTEGHDWPITHPERMAERIREAVSILGSTCA